MFSEIFKAILLTSLIGTALGAILLLIRPITKRCFSNGWHYFMWILVLVIMVLPIKIKLPELNLANNNDEFSEIFYMFLSENVLKDNGEGHISEENESLTGETEKNVSENMWKVIYEYGIAKLALYIKIITVLWIIIAAGLFMTRLAGYVRFIIKVYSDSELTECSRLHFYTNRKVVVRVSEMVNSPIMFGIFKPTLILPKVELSSCQLDFVLAHEMVHFKRHDILFKWFALIVKCIHWFNPMVYFINKQINIECEISCDLRVVEAMNKEEKIGYIDTILALLSASDKSESVPFTAVGMLDNKKALKRRFLMIKNRTKISKKVQIASCAAAAVFLMISVSISGVMASEIFDKESAAATTTIAAANQEEAVKADTSEKSYNQLTLEAKKESTLSEAKPVAFVWPCPSSHNIAATYGVRVHPITGEESGHTGIDIVAMTGEAVVAAVDGIVVETGFDTGKGNYIIISTVSNDDNASNVKTIYNHLSEIIVAKGDSVTLGQTIGKIGSTGMSTGPHLHFEILVNGENVNPESFFAN